MRVSATGTMRRGTDDSWSYDVCSSADMQGNDRARWPHSQRDPSDALTLGRERDLRSSPRLISLRTLLTALLTLASAGCAAKPEPSIPLPLKLVADIPIEHASSRFDYESLDPATGLLFIADLAGSHVLVFDTRANRFVHTIEGVAKVHGVLAVPARGMVYASATRDDQLAVIDATTFAVRARIPAGHYPDGIAWAPNQGKLYVSDEHGNSVAVIDAARGTLLAKIPVGGEVGNTQYNSADGMIYSNVQTRGEMVVIDPATDREVRRIKVPGCESNHGLSVDPTRQLAWVACEDNARLVTLSLVSGTVIDSQSVGAGPDVLAWDPGLKRLYVAAESGPLTVFDVSTDKPLRIGAAKLADNAHVVAVDPATHRVYFPLRNVGGRPVLRVMEPR
jgi:YVTN family beta-propeller protein